MGTGTNQLAATSTPQNASKKDHSWLQQADLDAADMFLDQLDETPAGGSGDSNHAVEKSSKPSKKCKPSQPWFMLPEKKCPQLDVSEVSSDQSSDKPLGESSVTSSSDLDSSVKRSKCCISLSDVS